MAEERRTTLSDDEIVTTPLLGEGSLGMSDADSDDADTDDTDADADTDDAS